MTTVLRYKVLNRTPAVPFLLKGWIELIASGFTDDTILLEWNDEAVVVVDSAGAIFGGASFQEVGHLSELFVKVAYVTPSRRCNGTFSLIIWPELIKIARERNLRFIAGGRHVRNLEKARLDARLGRPDEFVSTRFKVGP